MKVWEAGKKYIRIDIGMVVANNVKDGKHKVKSIKEVESSKQIVEADLLLFHQHKYWRLIISLWFLLFAFSAPMDIWCVPAAWRTYWQTLASRMSQQRVLIAVVKSTRRYAPATWPWRRPSRSCPQNASTARNNCHAPAWSIMKDSSARRGVCASFACPSPQRAPLPGPTVSHDRLRSHDFHGQRPSVGITVSVCIFVLLSAFYSDQPCVLSRKKCYFTSHGLHAAVLYFSSIATSIL